MKVWNRTQHMIFLIKLTRSSIIFKTFTVKQITPFPFLLATQSPQNSKLNSLKLAVCRRRKKQMIYSELLWLKYIFITVLESIWDTYYCSSCLWYILYRLLELFILLIVQHNPVALSATSQWSSSLMNMSSKIWSYPRTLVKSYIGCQ